MTVSCQTCSPHHTPPRYAHIRHSHTHAANANMHNTTTVLYIRTKQIFLSDRRTRTLYCIVHQARPAQVDNGIANTTVETAAEHGTLLFTPPTHAAATGYCVQNSHAN